MGLYMSLLRDAAHTAERDGLMESLAQCAQILDSQFNAILGVNETDDMLENAERRRLALQAVFDRIAVQVRPRGREGRLAPARGEDVGLGARRAGHSRARARQSRLQRAALHRSGGVLLGARRRRDRVEIYVVDTGVGIAPEHRDAVFRDFYQVGNPERNPDRGFGLGLGIVRRLCTGMNWRVEMTSRRAAAPPSSFRCRSRARLRVPRPRAQVLRRSRRNRRTRRCACATRSSSTTIRRCSTPWSAFWRAGRFARDSARRRTRRWRSRSERRCDQLECPDRLSARRANWTDSRWRSGFRSLYGQRVLPAIITGDADEAIEAPPSSAESSCCASPCSRCGSARCLRVESFRAPARFGLERTQTNDPDRSQFKRGET